jgi:hypothetical protein
MSKPLIQQAVHGPGARQNESTHGWRGKLNERLHGPSVHALLNVLLLFDLVTLIIGMLLELHFFESQTQELTEA